MKRKNKKFDEIEKEKSSLWFNELIWDPESMVLNIEIVGKQKLDERYFVSS